MSPDSDMHGDVVTGLNGPADPGPVGNRSCRSERESARILCTMFGGIWSVKSCWQVPPTPVVACRHIASEGMPQERVPLKYMAQ